MQATLAHTFQQATVARRSSRTDRRAGVVVRAQQHEQLSRREAGLAALAAVAALAAPRPAYALFGLGEKASETYERVTATIIADTRNAATLARDAPNREATMEAVRVEINDWVARYRRDTGFSGRPSYGNVYTAVNAMAGHLNSFGPNAPVPKKRLERMLKELDEAERFLSRGR